jgi:8-oxo-dGTP pyrophosphatase MutT (NUDIX family)
MGTMRSERSAGVIAFRNEPDVPGGRVFLLLDYGRYWDLPKGHLDKDEDDLTAALRELEEETGISDAQLIDGFAREMAYFFRDRRKGLIRKEVIFFLAETKRKRVKLSHEHVGSAFLPLEEAIERLTYRNAKEVVRAAGEFLVARGA